MGGVEEKLLRVDAMDCIAVAPKRARTSLASSPKCAASCGKHASGSGDDEDDEEPVAPPLKRRKALPD